MTDVDEARDGSRCNVTKLCQVNLQWTFCEVGTQISRIAQSLPVLGDQPLPLDDPHSDPSSGIFPIERFPRRLGSTGNLQWRQILSRLEVLPPSQSLDGHRRG
jgi:hypothetical protein